MVLMVTTPACPRPGTGTVVPRHIQVEGPAHGVLSVGAGVPVATSLGHWAAKTRAGTLAGRTTGVAPSAQS